MPAYHIVAADSRAARTGRFLEIVGRYEPMQAPALISTKEDRLFYWLRHGALPTDTVRSLLRKNGSWIKWSLKKKGSTDEAIQKEMEKWEMLQEGRRQREQERKARRSASKKEAKKGTAASVPPEQAAAAPPEAAPA
jgi:small subunit ribosomal protein S16